MENTILENALDLDVSSTHKVLVSDPLSEAGITPLRSTDNLDVDIRTDLSPAELVTAIADYDALIVRSGTQVTAEVIKAGGNLRVVARAGVGVDNIDVDAATQAGVIVVNAPTGNTVAAAEHTIAMLMAVARNIPQADAHVRGGEWKRSRFTGIEVRDKVLGSVGLGRVAQEVARRAIGLGMTVVAYDPYVAEEYAEQRGVRLVSLDEVIEQADFLTLHVPMSAENRHMIDAAQFARMKPTARLLNVARGGIVNEQALVDAIRSGQITAAAIDVFEQEPLAPDSPLRNCEQIILTPHLGASTVEAQDQVAEDVALQVLDVLNDRPARYAVNAPIMPPKAMEFQIPYIELAEQMGKLIKQLGAQGVKELEITAHGALSAYDLAYIKAAAIKGLLTDAVQMRINLVNAGLIAEKRGISVIERKQAKHDMRHETMLTITATGNQSGSATSVSGNERYTIRGAILHGVPHIVAIDDIWVDFPAQGHLLVSPHDDRPGIIGQVGTILGQADINISFMHVGRHAPRSGAIMVIGTDEPVPVELVRKLEESEDIYWLKTVSL